MKVAKKIQVSLFEIFYELSLHGNFTNTAKVLGVTKAAISHSVKQLEKEIGVDLLNRTTRTVSLTHEGRLLLGYCESLQFEIDSIRDLSKSFHSEPSGILRVSTTPYFAREVLPLLIKEYSQKFPKVQVDVLIEERMPDFKIEQVDLILGVNWEPPEDVVARKIAETRYVLCATPRYLSDNACLNNLGDLQKHNYIGHKSRSTAMVAIKKEDPFFKIDIRLSANDSDFIKECVLADIGIAQFHLYMVEDEIENGELVSLLEDEFADQQDIFIYYQKNKFVQPKVKEFVRLVTSTEILL